MEDQTVSNQPIAGIALRHHRDYVVVSSDWEHPMRGPAPALTDAQIDRVVPAVRALLGAEAGEISMTRTDNRSATFRKAPEIRF